LANIAPHKHCIVCGSAVGPDDSFCDELCELKYRSSQRHQKMIFIGFVVLLLLFTFAPPLIGSLKSGFT
jgi:predicted nucleic acid-binding Zn ribbon protein